jgi:mercuric ion binding protein
MKNKMILLFVTITIYANIAAAQQAKNSEINIQTSGHCTECKKTIEKALSFEKGVKEAQFNPSDGMVKIIYNPSKTDADKLRKAITMAGYDADSLQADAKAYSKLKECCKKGGMNPPVNK